MNKRLLFSVAVVSVNHIPLMKLTTPNIQNGLHGPNPLIIVLSSDFAVAIMYLHQQY